jgi:hypothetical protein
MMKILVALLLVFAVSVQAEAQSDTLTVKIKNLGSYWKHGEVGGDLWHNVLVPKNIKKDELIAVAKALFKAEPGYYRFFTDDKEFKAFIASDFHYMRDSKHLYPYPEKWANKHYLAIINKYFGGEWTLSAQSISGQKFAPSADDSLIVTLGPATVRE